MGIVGGVRSEFSRLLGYRELQEKRETLAEKVYLELIGRSNIPDKAEDAAKWAGELRELAWQCAKAFYPM